MRATATLQGQFELIDPLPGVEVQIGQGQHDVGSRRLLPAQIRRQVELIQGDVIQAGGANRGRGDELGVRRQNAALGLQDAGQAGPELIQCIAAGLEGPALAVAAVELEPVVAEGQLEAPGFGCRGLPVDLSSTAHGLSAQRAVEAIEDQPESVRRFDGDVDVGRELPGQLTKEFARIDIEERCGELAAEAGLPVDRAADLHPAGAGCIEAQLLQARADLAALELGLDLGFGPIGHL